MDITCKKHNIKFKQLPSKHKKEIFICSECLKEKKKQEENKISEKYLEIVKEIHNNFYDYSNVVYTNCKEKIKIICPIHGEFEQEADSHKRGIGCKKCGIEIVKEFHKKDNWIDDFIKKHQSKYDYSESNYINNNTKIKIFCNTCKEYFYQTPHNHLNYGCGNCAGNKPLTIEKFYKKAKDIHGDKYIYHLDNSIAELKLYTFIKIECKKHGIFNKKIVDHINRKSGCPTCKMSKGENTIRVYLENNNIIYEYNKTFPDCRDKGMLKFDFYLSNNNTIIEFDGIQHNKIIERFGGKNELEQRKKRDEIKNRYCKEKNIKLIRIKHTDNIIEIFNKNFIYIE